MKPPAKKNSSQPANLKGSAQATPLALFMTLKKSIFKELSLLKPKSSLLNWLQKGTTQWRKLLNLSKWAIAPQKRFMESFENKTWKNLKLRKELFEQHIYRFLQEKVIKFPSAVWSQGTLKNEEDFQTDFTIFYLFSTIIFKESY